MESFLTKIESAAMRSKITLLVDENIEELVEPLRLKGFKVIFLEKSLSDAHIQALAEGTAIVTKNSKDFLKNAKAYDYDIIALEHVKFNDKDPGPNNKTVDKIVTAVRDSQFYNKRGNWLLTIYSDLPYKLTEIVI